MEKMMNKIIFGLALSLCLVGDAGGNQLADLGPREHARRASVIIVATLESTGISAKVGDFSSTAARFKVDAVLKGEVAGQFVLVPYRYASEFSYDCCDKTKRYLLFLQAPAGEIYYPVNGRFSIYEISGHPTSSSSPMGITPASRPATHP
jgi:hypothetical protein